MTTIVTQPYEAKRPSASRVADGLCLLATPAFAAMALATAGGGMTMPGMSALSGMSLMYLLMSVFHAAPWLKRVARPFHSRNIAKENDA